METNHLLGLEHALLLRLGELQFKGDLPSQLQEFSSNLIFFKISHQGKWHKEKKRNWHQRRFQSLFLYRDSGSAVKSVEKSGDKFGQNFFHF